MAVIQVKIIDKYGTVLETKEIQDFQLETLQMVLVRYQACQLIQELLKGGYWILKDI